MFVSALAATSLPAAGFGAVTSIPSVQNLSPGSRPDEFAIEFGVAARPAAPGYVGRHTSMLNFPPRRLVAESGMGTAQGITEIVRRNGCELEAGRGAARNRRFIGIDHGIFETTDARHDGDRTIPERTKLREAARLEARGNDKRIAAGLDQMGERLVVSDHDADPSGIGGRGLAVVILQLGVPAAEQRELHSFAR